MSFKLYKNTPYIKYAIASVVFFCVWMLIYSVHKYLWFYYDDYALSGLSYAWKPQGLFSERLTLHNYISFLYNYYITWGGRLVPVAIILPIMHAGPKIFWFFQSIIITCILVLTANFATVFTKKDSFYLNLLIALISYTSIHYYLSSGGLYWGCAATIYVCPILPILIAFTLLLKQKYSAVSTFFIALFLFIASSSSEPYAIFTFTSLCSLIALDIFYKKNRTELFKKGFWIFISFCGMIICCLAPGNFNRAKVMQNKISFFYNGALSETYTFFTQMGTIGDINFPLVFIIVCFFYLCQVFLKKDKQYITMVPFIVGAFSSTCIFLLQYTRNPHTFIYFIFLSIVIATPGVYSITNTLFTRKGSIILFLYCLTFTVPNYLMTRNGYKANYKTILENHQKLSQYQKGTKQILLKSVPNELFGMSRKVYRDHENTLVKSYYDIPEEVQLIYNDDNNP